MNDDKDSALSSQECSELGTDLVSSVNKASLAVGQQPVLDLLSSAWIFAGSFYSKTLHLNSGFVVLYSS